MNAKGFSLMELMVVILIIAALASMALPSYNTSVERVKVSEGVHILTALLGAQNRFALENGGAFSGNLAALDIDVVASDNFNIPTVSAVDPIARIQRNDGTYTLTITQTGTLNCLPPGALCNRIRIW